MMPDFSEFSYGFAFTHEYVNRSPRLETAPDLPSLIREAELGYDLKLGYPGHSKFFQFKLSAYLDRRNTIHWPIHSQPHYRVRISTRARPNRPLGTDQHSQLQRLAATQPNVYYVAPRFRSRADLNYLFIQRQVTTNSMWVPLRALPLVSDNEVHYITFTSALNDAPLWHSEAMILEGIVTAEEHYKTIDEVVIIDEDYFLELRAKLLATSNEPRLISPEKNDLDDDIASVLRDVYRLLTAQFGLQMVTLVENKG